MESTSLQSLACLPWGGTVSVFVWNSLTDPTSTFGYHQTLFKLSARFHSGQLAWIDRDSLKLTGGLPNPTNMQSSITSSRAPGSTTVVPSSCPSPTTQISGFNRCNPPHRSLTRPENISGQKKNRLKVLFDCTIKIYVTRTNETHLKRFFYYLWNV